MSKVHPEDMELELWTPVTPREAKEEPTARLWQLKGQSEVGGDVSRLHKSSGFNVKAGCREHSMFS